MPRIATEKQKCLSRVAYDRIKVMILQKELMPGQFINESQLQNSSMARRRRRASGVSSSSPGESCRKHWSWEGHRCGRPCWRWHRTGW